jgi:hypothetical protein
MGIPKSVSAGSPFPVPVRITNSGNGPIIVRWDTTDPIRVQIGLTTKDNKPVPLTLYGNKMFHPTDLRDIARQMRGSIRGQHLQAGQATQALSVPNLALFYDLTLPGEYDLTVTAFVTVGEGPKAKEVKLKAGSLRFTVTDP